MSRAAAKADLHSVAEFLPVFGDGNFFVRRLEQLPIAPRKRIGLARAIILKPEIILYDEPTTGLDPITSKEISQLILDIQKKYNTSGIIITHDVECARLTSNRVIMLKDGCLEVEGTFKELAASDDEWVNSFFK